MIVRRKAMFARVLGQKTDVFEVIAAYIHVKEHHVAVRVLLSHQIPEVLAGRDEGLRQARLLVPRIQSKVENRCSRVGQPVRDFGPQQAAVSSDIYPETSLGGIIDNFVHHLGAQQWFATHESQHAAAVVMQPIDRTARHVFRHAFNLVVERPAVPAVDVAFVLDEQVSSYRMKIPRHHARADVRTQPAAYLAHELFSRPLALFGRRSWPGDREQFRILREYRFRQRRAFGLRWRRWMSGGMQQQIVD